jgi:hypothetical protein
VTFAYQQESVVEEKKWLLEVNDYNWLRSIVFSDSYTRCGYTIKIHTLLHFTPNLEWNVWTKTN